MRVWVDRGTHAVQLELGEAPEARRAAVADGVTVLYDAAERIVGVEVRGVDPATLHAFTVELAGFADRPAAGLASAHPVVPPPVPPLVPSRSAPASPPTPHTRPLAWDPDAAAAVLRMPFFRRGQHRLAASALTRRRGLDRVSVEVVHDVRL